MGRVHTARGCGPALGGVHQDCRLLALEHAGLVQSRRDGRFIIYTAVYPALAGLVEFLMRDCCQGHPEICAPVMTALVCACDPSVIEKA